MRFADRVKETTTTTGTGDVTLAGAVSGYETFTTNFATDEKFYYVIALSTEWEVGFGHLSGASTLVRDEVLQSSNADALVSFSSGTKDVFVTIPGRHENSVATIGVTIAAQMAALLR